MTWVDVNVEKHQSAAAFKAYLAYLFTDAAQEIFAKNGYRPINEAVLKKFDAYQAMFLLGIFVGVIQILIVVFRTKETAKKPSIIWSKIWI